MDLPFKIDEVDTDGAIRETADAVSGDTRLDFLKKAGVAGAGMAGGGALIGLVPGVASAASSSRPPAKFGKGDIGILNFALTLEYLEATFYNEAKASGAITDPLTKTFLDAVVRDENAHVAFLKKQLGSKAAKKPKFNFKGATSDQAKFQALAFALENTGVHAYSGQAFNIKSPKVLAAALSIVTIEARHAGLIGAIVKGTNGVAPSGPRDTPFTAKQVLAAAGPFIV